MTERDYNKTTWVTNTREKPDCEIDCQNCPGVIIFSKDEITRAKIEGKTTSTPCKFCGWHPGFPPEPWRAIDDSTKFYKSMGYNGQFD